MLRDFPVRDLMVSDVVTFAPDQNVQEAMRVLVGRSIGGAPVVDEEGRVIGVLSVSDLIVEEARLHFPTMVNFFGVNVALPWHDRELDESVSKALGEFVHEVMTDKPVTVTPDATIEDVATAMHDKQVSRVPVVDDDGRLVGLITRGDILRAVVRGIDDPNLYDAGDESTERLGEAGGADLDAAARQHREARDARHPTATIPGAGADDDPGELGADVGRI
jgi:CBS domain-containing protein